MATAQAADIEICPVIMAGGGGTRLWPLSRQGHPKQFLGLAGPGRTLLQDSLLRLEGLAGNGWSLQQAVVVTNEDYRFLVLDQLAGSGHAQAAVILEPAGRNSRRCRPAPMAPTRCCWCARPTTA
jgi:mannose-1-phosphate guanylyltransferase/mannose-6-phosphate isomerase